MAKKSIQMKPLSDHEIYGISQRTATWYEGYDESDDCRFKKKRFSDLETLAVTPVTIGIIVTPVQASNRALAALARSLHLSPLYKLYCGTPTTISEKIDPDETIIWS